MKFTQKTFESILIFFLVAGCVVHPAAAAAGLLILAGSQMAERYFTRNISDQDRRAIAALKVDIEKIQAVHNKEGLTKAFGGRQ